MKRLKLWLSKKFCMHKNATLVNKFEVEGRISHHGNITINLLSRTIEHWFCKNCGKEKIGEAMWRNYEKI